MGIPAPLPRGLRPKVVVLTVGSQAHRLRDCWQGHRRRRGEHLLPPATQLSFEMEY